MHWVLKCLAFHALGTLPGGRQAYRWAQEHVTRNYFRQLTPERVKLLNVHVEHYQTSPGVALEFGAGGDLLAPLLLSAAGAEKIITCDISRLATTERVNNIIRQLRSMGVPGHWRQIASFDELESIYRIQYLAPIDVTQTRLPAKSVNFVWSTSCLEHVPTAAIRPILLECMRVCSGRMSFIIDYHDHYDGVSRVNFYRFSERQWSWLNPTWHHQNRLRHVDFEQLFNDLKLSALVNERTNMATVDELVALSSSFQRYSREDLLTLEGTFLLDATAADKSETMC